MRRLARRILFVIADLAVSPLLIPAALLMKLVRRIGVERLPIAMRLLLLAGVFPIRNHYYEPRFDFRRLDRPLDEPRELPGVDLRSGQQTELLKSFIWRNEFAEFAGNAFRLDNGMFEGNDAAFYYNLIRLKKPRMILEIGSGQSTLVARAAIQANRRESAGGDCDLLCIEPYEAPWLESFGVTVLRQRVEAVDAELFSKLRAGDILFIDSSHVIRPQGDVTHLYLHILPGLPDGVIVHVHDIFTPRDYPRSWLAERVWLWNEQYLLEALLSGGGWQVLAAVNHLYRDASGQLDAGCGPHVGRGQPTSFYMVRNSARPRIAPTSPSSA